MTQDETDQDRLRQRDEVNEERNGSEERKEHSIKE